jgi:hypothetical protein
MWEILGISPTSDIKAIKRAYAAKLKQTHPQDDPVAFQALRHAYDWALQEAKFIKDEFLELANELAVAQPLSHKLQPDGFAEATADKLETQPATKSLIEPKQVTNNKIQIEIIDPSDKEIKGLGATSKTPDPPITTLQQQTLPHLFQQTLSHASTLLKLLEETDERKLTGTLAAYFEQDWFIHIDAKAMLEAQLIKSIVARQVSPSYKVFAALMEFFDWGNETIIRNHDDDKRMDSIRWQFKLEREIYAVKTAKDKGWFKARFLALVKNPPKPMAFRFYAINLLIHEEAKRKLTLWDEEFPDIYTYLNPVSVAWWRDRLAGKVGPLFRFGSHSIWHFFGASFLASFISIAISAVTDIFDPKSPAYQVFTWIFTLALFLWFSLHKEQLPGQAPKEFSLLKPLLTNARQFVKSRLGRLIGFGFVTINSLLLLVTFNDSAWLLSLINLYFALLVWLEFRVFKWVFFSTMTMFMLSEFLPDSFNNKSSILHVLGMVVCSIGVLKINKVSETKRWSKTKNEFIFVLWLLLMLVLPILLYSQMSWLVENMTRVSVYLTIVANKLLDFKFK